MIVWFYFFKPDKCQQKLTEGVRFYQTLIFIPSVVKDATVSLRLGHATALTVHRTVIHYRADTSLPYRGAKDRFLLTLNIIMRFTSRFSLP